MTARTVAGLVCLAALAATGCASHAGPVPYPFPRPGRPPSAPATADLRPVDANALIATALSLRGAPYVWGGTTPGGFDCSGFTRYVYAQHGVDLPRVAAAQYRAGTKVALRELRPGDLVFFSTIAPGPSHVGMAIGKDRFVHAPNQRSEVRIDNINTRYWRRRFIGARRVANG